MWGRRGLPTSTTAESAEASIARSKRASFGLVDGAPSSVSAASISETDVTTSSPSPCGSVELAPADGDPTPRDPTAGDPGAEDPAGGDPAPVDPAQADPAPVGSSRAPGALDSPGRGMVLPSAGISMATGSLIASASALEEWRSELAGDCKGEPCGEAMGESSDASI